MNELARRFDMPLDSPEHQILAKTAWMAGPLVALRYVLGRCINRNLFREDDDVIKAELKGFFLREGWDATVELIDDISTWNVIAEQLQFHLDDREAPTERDWRRIIAVDTFLAHPSKSDLEIAAIANSTEKFVEDLSALKILRRSLAERNND